MSELLEYPSYYPSYYPLSFQGEQFLAPENLNTLSSTARSLREFLVQKEQMQLASGTAIWEQKLAPFEGSRKVVYLDAEGFHTTGRGKKFRDLDEAKQLMGAFAIRGADGVEREASTADIEAAWAKASKSIKQTARLDDAARSGQLTGLAYLKEGQEDLLFAANKTEAIRGVKAISKGALLAAEPEVIAVMLDMQYAHGSGGAARFKRCNAALRASMSESDPQKKAAHLRVGARECQVSNQDQLKRNPGWLKRNDKRKQLLEDAAQRFEAILNRMELVSSESATSTDSGD
jgi:hypothetical protein